MKSLEKSSFTRINAFQDTIDWGPNQGVVVLAHVTSTCCEDGPGALLLKQRVYPGTPLENTPSRYPP